MSISGVMDKPTKSYKERYAKLHSRQSYDFLPLRFA